MWTPKRIVLLAGGFILFVTSYFCYSLSFFGGIDGLPTLPEGLARRDGKSKLPVLGSRPRRGERIANKLRDAFGLECPELGRVIKLELRSRRMVLAANEFKLEEDGWRVVLSPISIAVFGKPKKPGQLPEINTIRGRVAYLKLDRPVNNMTEMNGRKIVGAELSGNIEIVHNRKTPERTDDLSVYMGTGPLYYDAVKNLITTNDTVHLKDLSSQPHPNEIWGKGMELELATKKEKKPGQRESETVKGAKRVSLLSNVVMFFYLDQKSGFLRSGRDTKKTLVVKAKANKTPKSRVVIKTPGRFDYVIGKRQDTATFTVPAATAEQPNPQPVSVKRHNPVLKANDQLLCQRLEIRLKGKDDGKEAPHRKKSADDSDQDTDIEYARATGPDVTLTSDVEKLEARGVEFVYDALKRLTIVKGGPHMTAAKDNHVIHARELTIVEKKDPNDPRGLETYHESLAIGPGRIDIYDKETDKNTMHAYWNQKLISTRDGKLDMLQLTGAAKFVDDVNKQTLQAETLKVWLEPKGDKTKGKKPHLVEAVPTGDEKQRASRLNHIEAVENVIVRSPELNIDNTSRLVVWFADDKRPTVVPPPAAKPVVSEPVGDPRRLPTHAAGKPSQSTKPDTRTAVGLPGSPPKKDKDEKPRPIHLEARSVEAWVLRGPEKNTLEKLWTEGNVHIHQAPKTPGEKGVDIQGETLKMDYHPEGNYLVVMGDLAQLRMEKMFILGPEVHIDQRANKAWVTGAGAMTMDSESNLNGEKLDRPMPMTIHWDRSMVFDGQSADFIGSIQAEQDTSRLACQHLQVFFDRSISLKEGNKGGKPTRIKHLVCHKEVRLEQSEVELQRLKKYQRIEAHSVSMNTLESEEPLVDPKKKQQSENEVRASGPGRIRMFSMGNSEPLSFQPGPRTPPKTRSKPASKKEMKLTYIEFTKSMYANSRSSKATFYGDVKVLNLPSNNPQMDIDLAEIVNKLPEGAMYLSCAMLSVSERGTPGNTKQEMRARGRVVVQAKKYWGRAAEVHFNEAKDQIILEGGDGLATLYKVVPKGARAQEIKGKTITYLRSTGAFKIDDGRWIFGN